MKITKGRVKQRVWGPKDTYLTVEAQVLESNGFQIGDEVLVTIEKTQRSTPLPSSSETETPK